MSGSKILNGGGAFTCLVHRSPFFVIPEHCVLSFAPFLPAVEPAVDTIGLGGDDSARGRPNAVTSTSRRCGRSGDGFKLLVPPDLPADMRGSSECGRGGNAGGDGRLFGAFSIRVAELSSGTDSACCIVNEGIYPAWGEGIGIGMTNAGGRGNGPGEGGLTFGRGKRGGEDDRTPGFAGPCLVWMRFCNRFNSM